VDDESEEEEKDERGIGFYRMSAEGAKVEFKQDGANGNIEQDGENKVDDVGGSGDGKNGEIGVNQYDLFSVDGVTDEGVECKTECNIVCVCVKNFVGWKNVVGVKNVVGGKRRECESDIPCYGFNTDEGCVKDDNVSREFTTTDALQSRKFNSADPALTTGALQRWLESLNTTFCEASHVCVVCGSSEHGWSKCPNQKFCKYYSKGLECGVDCDRRHGCVLCHLPHPVGDRVSCKRYTEMIVEGVDPESFCLDWNADSRCREDGGCKDRHHCCFCSSISHESFACIHALDMLLCEFGGSLHQDKRLKGVLDNN
jgi:hypothetical protein